MLFRLMVSNLILGVLKMGLGEGPGYSHIDNSGPRRKAGVFLYWKLPG